MKKILNRKRKAFTVVELIIVLAIITILLLLYITKMDFASNRARLAGVQSDFRSFYIATKAVQQENAMGELSANGAFEAALNKNLDAALQFTSGTCKLNSPYGYPYKMTTKFADDGESLEVLFSTQSNKHTTIYYSLSDLKRSTSDTNLEGKIAYGCVLTNDSLTELAKTEAAALAPANTNPDSGGSGSSSSSGSGSSSTPTEKALSSIAITTPPTKTTYTAGENFDPTGMMVTATYTDSSTSAVTGYTLSNNTNLTTNPNVIVSFSSGGVTKTVVVSITVNPAADAWDTNPMTSEQAVDKYIGYYNIDSSSVGIGISRVATEAAYSRYTSPKEINIPTSINGKKVTEIGQCAFKNKAEIQCITIPSTVTRIFPSAFSGCTNMNTVDLSDGLSIIDVNAFSYCISLYSMNLPSSISSIGESVFLECGNLTDINIGEGGNTYCSVNGIVYSKDMGEIVLCPSGKTGSFVIPDSVNVIDLGAFYKSKLSSITISSSVTTINNYAFEAYTKTVTIPDTVTSIGYGAFYNVPHIYYHGSATGSPWGAKAIN